MSIYISIPTLYDNQIEYTVKEAISCADNPDDITIGLVLLETDDSNGLKFDYFYENKIKPLLEYKQVKFKRHLHGEYEISVGFGRDEAMSMYDGEDYILQVDSHTLFEKHWDTMLINIYEKALKETNNDKTILTAYLPQFSHLDTGERVSRLKDKYASYPVFLFRCWYTTSVPSWKDSDLRSGPRVVDDLFVPCIKFNAQFAFSNKNYAGHTGLPVKTIFWEEEIIQTMNLLYDGFSLVFPNMVLPLSHLFQNDVSNDVMSPSFRISGANPQRLSMDDYYAEIEANWREYVLDPENKDKIAKFSEYTKLNLKYGPFMQGYIPKKYNR